MSGRTPPESRLTGMLLGPVRNEITRAIWGHSDAVLLIFGGAAAEFALSRAVDWLFVSEMLPRDPIGRLFSTVRYARAVVFGADAAGAALARIQRAHAGAEARRGAAIPQWAYRAVLYLLIDYSERATWLLAGPLARGDQEALYADFRRVGNALGIADLPATYEAWRRDRARQLTTDLVWSSYTAALYQAYHRQLGPWRYALLRRVQAVLVPGVVRELLQLPTPPTRPAWVMAARWMRRTGAGRVAPYLVMPVPYWSKLWALEQGSR